MSDNNNNNNHDNTKWRSFDHQDDDDDDVKQYHATTITSSSSSSVISKSFPKVLHINTVDDQQQQQQQTDYDDTNHIINNYNDSYNNTMTDTTNIVLQQYTIPSSDIIRLIVGHLVECGLYHSVQCIQQETGIGLAGTTIQQSQSHENNNTNSFYHLAITGQWSIILQQLSMMDIQQRSSTYNTTESSSSSIISLLAAVHEMTILELVEYNEWELAYTMFKLLQQDDIVSSCISEIASVSSNDNNNNTNHITICRSMEQKMAHIMAERQHNPNYTIPNDYYGSSSPNQNTNTTITGNGNNSDMNIVDTINTNKQLRRNDIGLRLQQMIPIQPKKRLITLIEQAMKWQTYTGQIPIIQQQHATDHHDDNDHDNDNNIHNNKKKKKQKVIKEFDLVLGEVDVDISSSSSNHHHNMTSKMYQQRHGKLISKEYSTIKFSKSVTCEAVVFLPNGLGMITGSSDGFIEIWDIDGTLHQQYIYQQNDDIMSHPHGTSITSLAISNDTTILASGGTDGNVYIWRIDTGKCLRTISVSSDVRQKSISCMNFSNDTSQLLIGMNDGTCREFGLRTKRMLKEFIGHTSYITTCYYHFIHNKKKYSPNNKSSSSSQRRQYKSMENIDNDNDLDHNQNHIDDQQLIVVTGSGDGTIRIWDGKTTDIIYILKPISIGTRNMLSTVGSSIVSADYDRANQSIQDGNPTIHSIIPIQTPIHGMIIVPRGIRAFLIDYEGTIHRTYQDDTSSITTSTTSATTTSTRDASCFVAATLSSTNRWLYIVKEDGICCIFDIMTGKMERTIPNFSTITCPSSSSSSSSITPNNKTHFEVSSMHHHPNKSIVAAFSNDKGQKRGKVVLWK